VLDGLARLGAPTTVLQRESYLYAWRAIGRVMGVREELIPADLEEARTLTDTIRRRQSAKSDVGDAMTAALLAVMEDSLPRVLHGFPPTLLRFFLEDDVKYLTMPPANWTRVLVVIMHAMTRAVDLLVGASRVSRWLYRAFNKRLIEGFLEVERGPKRPNFAIPDHLARQWGVKD
jgi:hypothetical protein